MAENEWVFESVIGFLRCPIWRVPILTFIESKCLVFDSDDENKLTYTEIHKEYQLLVEELLDSFISDIGIESEAFVEACLGHTENEQQSTLALFEQVQAAQDFNVFKRMILRKNIELELQALEMIQKRSGVIPEVLKPGQETKVQYSVSEQAERDEDMLLQEVLRISKEEYEAHKSAKLGYINEDMDKAIASSKEDEVRLRTEKAKEDDLLNQAILLSKHNIPVQSKEKKKGPNDQSMPKIVAGTADLSLKENEPSSSAKAEARPPKSSSLTSSLGSTPTITKETKSAPTISGAEAAANWLSSAKSESSGESQVSARAAALASSSPGELQKREEYLKQQRDRLLALKKKEREKNLSAFTAGEAASRPKSARAARQVTAALDSNSNKSSAAAATRTAEEQEKKLAMRKALAERLKQEVINK